MIGLWLDGLGDVERDRVIEAQGWCFAGWNDGAGNRCLLSHACDLHIYRDGTGFFYPSPEDHAVISSHQRVWSRYDDLCARFGKDRVVRAIKARAARGVTSKVMEEEKAYAPV